MSIQSVLIYSMEEVIGDGLIKLPFVAALRDAFPDARISWCAAKGGTVYATALKPVVAGLIDETLTTGATGAKPADILLFKPPFGGRSFDVVIDTQTNVSRSLFVKRARARGGVFVSQAADFALSDVKPKGAWPLAMVDRLVALLSLAAGREVRARPVSLVDPRAAEAARVLLPDGLRYVGFAPGAGGQVKRWPLERYLSLAEKVAGEGLTPVFFVGPDEADIREAVRARLPAALMPEADRTDDYGDVKGPMLVIALAGRLTAAAANDAGPGHMLAAGGAPLVSLNRSRRMASKFPPSARRLELVVGEDFGAESMDAIPEAAVWERLKLLIAEA